MGFAHGICKKTFHSNYCIFLNKSHIYHSWCTRQNFIRRHSSTSDEERCLAKVQSEKIQRSTSNSPTYVDSRTCIQDSSVLPVKFIFTNTRWRWKYTATSFAVEPFVESYELFCVVLSLLMEEGSHNGLKEPKTNWSKNPVWKFFLYFIGCITKIHMQSCQCVEFMRHILLMANARKCCRKWL